MWWNIAEPLPGNTDSVLQQNVRMGLRLCDVSRCFWASKYMCVCVFLWCFPIERGRKVGESGLRGEMLEIYIPAYYPEYYVNRDRKSVV